MARRSARPRLFSDFAALVVGYLLVAAAALVAAASTFRLWPFL